MGYLIASFWLLFLIAGALGLLTGRWMWAARAQEQYDAEEQGAAPIIPPAPVEEESDVEVEAEEPEPAPEPAPEAEPEPELVDPEPEPEPVVAESEEPLELEEAMEEAPAASPFLSAPSGDPDDLTKIKGVGPKLNDLLHELGVFHFSQIAGWSDAQVEEVDSHLDTFRGRISRDRWIDQARYLAAGDFAGFEHEFGPINGHR